MGGGGPCLVQTATEVSMRLQESEFIKSSSIFLPPQKLCPGKPRDYKLQTLLGWETRSWFVLCLLKPHINSVQNVDISSPNIYCWDRFSKGSLWPVSTGFPKRQSHIFVVDTFEQHQLPVGTLGVGLVLEGPTQLFHRHWNTEDCVQSRAGHTSYGQWKKTRGQRLFQEQQHTS